MGRVSFSFFVAAISLLDVLFFLSPSPTYACDTTVQYHQVLNGTYGTTNTCQNATCNNSVYQAYVEYSNSPNYLNSCTQLEYFPNNSCTYGTQISNPCPAQCDPSAAPDAPGGCNLGTCASGSISYLTVCQTGNIGTAPYWCQSYNCGYKCSSSYTCDRIFPGGVRTDL